MEVVFLLYKCNRSGDLLFYSNNYRTRYGILYIDSVFDESAVFPLMCTLVPEELRAQCVK